MLDMPSLVTIGGTKACARVSAWGPAPPRRKSRLSVWILLAL